MLKNIADDLRCCLPPEAVLCSEQLALQRMRQQPEPTVHVDAFLYDEDVIDSLCEEGKMSRNYCTGYLYSSAAQLCGVELNGEFCQLQEMVIKKYQFSDRIKVLHADICTQGSLLQSADVIVMNNVFEYFLTEAEQASAWNYIIQNVRKQGALLVTVPSLQGSLLGLEINVQLSSWVEEIPLNLDMYPQRDIDREALEQIHLYKVLQH
ncbi:hypothetical protein A6R68_22844 [Neotoma lepida]|uniref:Methyltransferase type 11 domain-containing protein n=1 Tax=Neotoma lepida TaxID=56216 RepID=A0A1A6HZK3_NEOLE|nr:hypothetical protein A6R68_22844 [Neotoma lepida]